MDQTAQKPYDVDNKVFNYKKILELSIEFLSAGKAIFTLTTTNQIINILYK